MPLRCLWLWRSTTSSTNDPTEIATSPRPAPERTHRWHNASSSRRKGSIVTDQAAPLATRCYRPRRLRRRRLDWGVAPSNPSNEAAEAVEFDAADPRRSAPNPSRGIARSGADLWSVRKTAALRFRQVLRKCCTNCNERSRLGKACKTLHQSGAVRYTANGDFEPIRHKLRTAL